MRILLALCALVLFAAGVSAQDATVAVTAPEINPTLSAYEQARAVIVDAVLALGAIGIAYLGKLAATLLGEGIANQVRVYMNAVFANVVTTQMGRIKNSQNAVTNEAIKDEIITKSADALKAKIPDALAKFGLDKNPIALADKIEAEITKVNLEADPQHTLASADPHGKAGNVDLDAAYVPPEKKP